MPLPLPTEVPSPTRRGCFRYGGFDIDERAGVVRCRYELDDLTFEERVSVGPGHDWSTPAATEAARLVALLAGVSYYKATAPAVIDLGDLAVRAGEAEFLRTYYLDGLGEFAYRNGLDLDGLRVVGGTPVAGPAGAFAGDAGRPLIPFGGGIDSIVTVELVRRRHPDAALFVVGQFAPLEAAAAVTGLPIRRAERHLDPQILRSDDNGFLNGHVPVTGILSAIAVLMAVLDGRGAVVMSNERSASAGNLVVRGRTVNHQFSKSLAFEEAFRTVTAQAIGPEFAYFSELRPFSELWIARRFAELTEYHPAFHSCNRAFHVDPGERRVEWCGECDKCCFIDLILSPFMSRPALGAVFAGREPLDNPGLLDRFRLLVDAGGDAKPFECVGDVDECRVAARLAADRPDRAGNPILAALLGAGGDAGADPFTPRGPHHIPDAFFPTADLG